MKPGDPEDGRRIYRVSELTRQIRAALENEFGLVWIEGELSNVHDHASGHIYFTLKDESAQIAAAMFRGNRQGLAFELKDGMKVRAYGQVTAYEPRSQYQVVVRKVEDAGKGSLQEQFERLKKKLAEEGLFSAERKRPLPLLPRHLGIVTSPTGAAIRDILKVLDRRFPNLHVVIAPARVQGEGAAQEIADGIDLLNRIGGLDVLIVGRGGGSLEDLWCFNEEIVARAIARSAIPVISAVGHEVDFTISDFVADVRAPTPSAAAEMVVGQKEHFEGSLREGARRLASALNQYALRLRARVLAAGRSYVFREPLNLVRRYAQQVDGLRDRMVHEAGGVLQDRRARIEALALGLRHGARRVGEGRSQDVRRLAAQLKALSPLAVLDRGFSITRTGDGAAVRDAAHVKTGDLIETQFARGRVESRVTARKDGGQHG